MPRQFAPRASETVMQLLSEAHHAHSSWPAQDSHPSREYSSHSGLTANRQNKAIHGQNIVPAWFGSVFRAPTATTATRLSCIDSLGHSSLSETMSGHSASSSSSMHYNVAMQNVHPSCVHGLQAPTASLRCKNSHNENRISLLLSHTGLKNIIICPALTLS